MSSIIEEAICFHGFAACEIFRIEKPVKREAFKAEKLVLTYEQIKEFRYSKLNFGLLIHKCNGIP